MNWDGRATWYSVSVTWPPVRRRGPLAMAGPVRHMTTSSRSPSCRGSVAARVLYDQLGCGKSDHLPDAPADFWTPELFKHELSLLVAGAWHRRPVRRYRPVVGRHARDGVRARPAGRPARDRRRRLTRTACRCGWRRRTGFGATCRPTSRRRSRAMRRPAPPTTPRRRATTSGTSAGCPVSRLRRAQLCADRGRADRLPHDERAQRVPLHRLAEARGTSPTAARDQRAVLAHLGPPRRGDAAHRRADRRAHPAAPWEILRIEPHARTSSSPRILRGGRGLPARRSTSCARRLATICGGSPAPGCGNGCERSHRPLRSVAARS